MDQQMPEYQAMKELVAQTTQDILIAVRGRYKFDDYDRWNVESEIWHFLRGYQRIMSDALQTQR